MGEMAPRRGPFEGNKQRGGGKFRCCESDINVWVRNGRNVAFRTECMVMMNLPARFIS